MKNVNIFNGSYEYEVYDTGHTVKMRGGFEISGVVGTGPLN